MRVAVITVSDSVARSEHEDVSGPAVAARAAELGWRVLSRHVVADEQQVLLLTLTALADKGELDVILTTGGTGIGPRDVTPEATAEACAKLLPGIAEVMREAGRRSTPRAVLSRAVAGVRGKTLVVNLPGHPRGAVESLDAVAELLPHAVAVLHGARHD